MKMAIMMASRNVTSDATWRGRHILRHDSVKGLCVNKYLIHSFFPATYVILFFLSNGNPSFEDRLLYVSSEIRGTPLLSLYPRLTPLLGKRLHSFIHHDWGPCLPTASVGTYVV